MPASPTSPPCPRCGSDFVQRTRPQEPAEYLLRFAHVYPFQCQVCAHRFTKYQSDTQRVLTVPDRRNYARVVTALRVSIAGDAGEGEGVAADLSMAGCSLRTTTKLTVGDRLRLCLFPQNDDSPILVERALVRSVTPATAGIQFVQFSSRGRERLSRVIRKLLAEERHSA